MLDPADQAIREAIDLVARRILRERAAADLAERFGLSSPATAPASTLKRPSTPTKGNKR